MKIMALENGDAHTGVAFSDPTGLLAGETLVLPSWNHEKLLGEVTALARSRGAEMVVLGLPRGMAGSGARASLNLRWKMCSERV